MAVSHPNGLAALGEVSSFVFVGRACWAREPSLPSARPLALGKDELCRVPFVADGRHSVMFWHAVCHIFAECPLSGTRQSASLPSARGLALGKA